MNRAIVISEVQIMSAMEQMCAESLDPETYQKWSDVAEVLRETRNALNGSTNEHQTRCELCKDFDTVICCINGCHERKADSADPLRAERERCAQVCDEFQKTSYLTIGTTLARLIRELP